VLTRKPKTTRARIVSATEDARSSVKPAAETARDKLGTATEGAISSVAATVGPALEGARERLAPVAESAIAEGRKQGRRAAAKSREAAINAGLIEPPKKSHKLRNMVLVLGLGGVAAFLYKKFTGNDADPAWTAGRDSAAADARATTPLHAAAVDETLPPGAVDDADMAPTAPFASEETVESTSPTTPDQPIEKKDL